MDLWNSSGIFSELRSPVSASRYVLHIFSVGYYVGEISESYMEKVNNLEYSQYIG